MQQVFFPPSPPVCILFDAIASDLETRGFSIQPNGIPPLVVDYLSLRLSGLTDADFHDAAIGRGQDAGKNRFVRSNKVSWIGDDDGDNPWADWILALQSALNEKLFLGLFSFESHFTRYDEGDYYRRHLDAFRGERNRVVSLVTYLNEGWMPGQGGELVLYHGDESISVSPEAGTLVVFLSEEVPHEVKRCIRTRHGVAGWFRLNSGLGTQLDPPR